MAERKVLALLKAGASVRIISPLLTETLAVLVEDKVADKIADKENETGCHTENIEDTEGRLAWWKRGYQQGDLAGAQLVFAATDNEKVQETVVQDANQADLLVNVADAPELCDFHVPAVVRRGDLTIAVSTNGASPAVAARVRRRLAEDYGQEYALLLRLMSELREQVCAGPLDCAERKILFQNILHDDIIDWIKAERWDLLRDHFSKVIGSKVEFDISQLKRNK